MSKRLFLIGYRIVFGLLGFAAVGAQFFNSVRLSLNLLSFFSFFTNLSNIFAAGVLLYGALVSARSRSRASDTVRGAATVYMTVVGIVFSTLLSGIPEAVGIIFPWVNIVVHYVMPLVVVIDWLIDPPLAPMPMRRALPWISIALLYCAYSLVRGAIIDWYPYPFLNPTVTGGYPGVTAYVAGILVFTLIVAACVIVVGNARSRISAERT